MKTYVIFIVFMSTLFIGKTINSQPCLPEGITFGSQYQINLFAENFPNCTEIIGDVYIGAPSNFTADISSLASLNRIKSIGGELKISNVHGLTSFIGLDSLVTIGGDLYIIDVRDLYSLTGLNNLQSIGERLVLWSNGELTNIYALMNLDTIGDDLYLFANHRMTNLSGLNNLRFIGGDLKLNFNWGLNSIAQLSKLNTIGGSLIIDFNDFLTSIEGLENVSFLGENLIISYSKRLVDLKELNRLTSIGGSIEIVENENLESLAGLENVVTIGGDLKIGIPTFNGPAGNPSLVSLTAFEKLTQMNGDLYICGNSSLVSLAGLDNIDKTGIYDIAIIGNQLLTFCEVKSVCGYLADPLNSNYIYNNEEGCTNREEVITACKILTLPEIDLDDTILLYPNPARDKLFISNQYGIQIKSVSIYNNVGQLVLFQDNFHDRLDISALSTGLYIVEIVSNNAIIKKKLLVK